MPIMAAPPQAQSTEISLGTQKLAIQNGCAGCAADGVVGKDGKLPAEDTARTQPSNDGGHALAAIAVQARLRPVGRAFIDHRLLRRRRQLELLRQAAELVPGGNDFLCDRRLVEFDGHRLGVTVPPGYAVSVNAACKIGPNHARSL